MKNKLPIYLMIFIFICGCQQKEKREKKTQQETKIIQKSIPKKEIFKNSFKIDTSLTEKIAWDFITVSNSQKIDSIASVCNCDKDKKNNSIKIQLLTGIPTKKTLDTLSEDSNQRWNTVLQTRDLGYIDRLNGQFKFLTIVLKDSLVKKINIHSKSTDKEYNGTDFKSIPIDKYKIKISKFDYSIASDIYGEFEFRLKKEFGLFENDTILKGSFKCNNWIIWDKEKIKNWKINAKRQNYIE
ncbi:hypothetical protein [Hwangdonia lutea]|uniref:Lipoprotein n=1 Tax=Hwangdonia lutea TaxID=3075823 RepID=A0AA97EL48_9FLAO|nr:hypothetical protein [Hwangdonia sp. SCSIO 19198]WOD42996.1 hypothetical protein RNZ46_13460 [Hwangdonia sp. SCSIO 19198]